MSKKKESAWIPLAAGIYMISLSANFSTSIQQGLSVIAQVTKGAISIAILCIGLLFVYVAMADSTQNRSSEAEKK